MFFMGERHHSSSSSSGMLGQSAFNPKSPSLAAEGMDSGFTMPLPQYFDSLGLPNA